MTTALDSDASRRSRDLGFAISVLLLAAAIAGVLFYGNWWRKNRLADVYKNRLQNALQSYQQLVKSENPDAQLVYVLGAEIDVIMRRLDYSKSNPEEAWSNFQFLRQHAHRLDALFRDTPNWDKPTLLSVKLGEVKRRVDRYQNRSGNYLAEIAESDSLFGDLAELQQIEDSVVLGVLGKDQADHQSLADLLTKANAVIDDCQADPAASEPIHDIVISRATGIASWLLGHQNPHRMELLETTTDEDSDDRNYLKKAFQLADNRTESLSAISQVMVAANEKSDPQSMEDALKSFDQIYRYEAKDSDGVLGQAMEIRFQAITGDWSEVFATIGELSQTDRISRREVAFVRWDAAAAILQLVGSKPWLDRMETRLQIEKGLETAIKLSRYSPEALKMLLAIGVSRSKRVEEQLEVMKLPAIDLRVIEAGRASPSSIIALTSEAIAAGIDQDDQRIREVIESESMLNVGLKEMLTSIAIWRSSTNGEPDSTEVKAWVQLMEAITQLRNIDRPRANGNAWLALAAWQSHAGDGESAAKSLQAASPLVGDSQLYIQIEDLMNRILS